MGQIASDRTALRIFEVFEHLWLAFSDIFGIFAGACFCLALGGKLHITKAVDLGLGVLNLLSGGLVALVLVSCQNRHSC